MQQAYKSLLLYILLLSITLPVIAKDSQQYAVSNIPAELKKNANAVIRENSIDFEILSPSKGKKQVKYAVTILKEGALNMSLLTLMYDKFIKVSDINGVIYDANGKKVKRIKAEDIIDVSANDGFSLYNDNRLKAIDPEHMDYPFTIEYTYTVEYKSLFFMPSFYLFEGHNVSIENAKYKVTVPQDYLFRYKEVNLNSKATQQEADGKKIYSWNFENVKATNHEPLSPHAIENYPCILTEPSLFEMDGYSGNFVSWKEFGDFIHALNEGKDELPDATKNEILDLIKDAESDKEKIARIYKYSQDKNRYVSIQVGIGGYQPFPAETVDRLSYGDCKALSNYTKALLKIANIEARYVLVQAGSRKTPIDKNFPSNMFNHAILCVPLAQDTIWLECTSSSSPCGYFGDFTDDRHVLLIEENNSRLIKTPEYSAEDNIQITTAEVKLDDSNDLAVDAKIEYKGVNYGDEYYLLYKDEKDRRKRVINSIDIPNFNLINYELSEERSDKPVFTKEFNLKATNYSTQMGSKILLKLNLFNTFESVPRFVRNRKNDVQIQRNFSESDTISYILPDYLAVEALPKEIKLESNYGKYISKAEVVDGKIIYTRYFQINKGKYPKEEYEPLREFLEKISNADQAKTMLVKKTS